MAEEEKKEEAAEEGGEEKKKSGGKLMGILIPVISSALTAAIVGVVIVKLMAPAPAPAPAEGDGHGEASEGGHKSEAQGESAKEEHGEESFSEEEFDPYAKKEHTGKYFQYDPLTISIFDREKVHYLRLKVVFELSDDTVKDELNAKDPQIKDSLIFVLGDFTVRELLDNQAKLLVKEVLIKTLNRLLGKGKVVDIYFTEFVVQ